MTDELNATPVTAEPVIETREDVATSPEVGADLATASDTGHEQKPVEAELSDGAKKAINKQHWKAQEAGRRADALQARLDVIEAEKAQQSVGTAPAIPDMPDQYDDDFAVKLAARDDAIRQNAEFGANQRLVDQQAQFQSDEATRLQQVESAKVQQTFVDTATEQGFEPSRVIQAAQAIGNYGVSDAVAGMLTTEADGPAMIMYLEQNPMELQNMQSMPVHLQVSHMNNIVRVGAASHKPQVSSAPPPPTKVTTSGNMSETDPLLDGLVIY